MADLQWMALVLLVFLRRVSPAAGAQLCNISVGSWQRDTSKPLYTGLNCAFASRHNCQANGRPNLDFQKQSWMPRGCSLDSLSAAKLAAAFKDKTVLVAGDSLAQDFTQALRCIANSGTVKLSRWRTGVNGKVIRGFQYRPQNFSIVSLFSHFLVARLPTSTQYINDVDLSTVDDQWSIAAKVADVIIFMGTNWWFSGTKNWYSKNQKLSLTDEQAYVIGMKTVADYLKAIGFRGHAVLLSNSPVLYGLPAGVAAKHTHCETTQILNSRQVSAIGKPSLSLLAIQQSMAASATLKVLDITTLSLYRPDAKIQNWHVAGGKLPAGGRDDCNHWCEAGVPDTWVQIVYNYILGRVAR